jgi:SRSO17 transposase
MERRYEQQLERMLAQAEVSPELTEGLIPRLKDFVLPFTVGLVEPEQRRHTLEYITGLLSNLDHKTSEGIAYLHDQDRQGLQKFIGLVAWEHSPLLLTLAGQVGDDLGEPDGVLVFDPSAFAKKGTKSVGVARQWCGRHGKIENCQVGIYMAYVSRKDHALVNTRLYLPKEWTKDRARRKAAGVPKGIKFRTRHELALEMLDEQGSLLPHTWVAGDDEMGRSSEFRRKLQGRGERYLLAVPSNTLVRDLDEPPPPYSGRGPHPKSPFLRLDRRRAAFAAEAWTRIEVRDGEKGPLVIEVLKRRVQARTPTGGTGPEELLFITRELQSDKTYKYDYYLSNADPKTPLEELARVAKAAHRIEECFKRAKGEAGLADYQVRNWPAWHHHQTLSLLAAWFLNQETRRGKNPDPCADQSAVAGVDCRGDRGVPRRQSSHATSPPEQSLAWSKRDRPTISSPIA